MEEIGAELDEEVHNYLIFKSFDDLYQGSPTVLFTISPKCVYVVCSM